VGQFLPVPAETLLLTLKNGISMSLNITKVQRWASLGVGAIHPDLKIAPIQKQVRERYVQKR